VSTNPLGADISDIGQGEAFDFSQFTRDGVSFFFAKASEGLTFTDPAFAHNMLEKQFIRGCYHFLTDEDIAQQAQHFADTVLFEPGMMAFVDVERSPELTVIDPNRVRQFCDLMAQHWNGYKIGVYMNLSTLQQFDWSPVASGDYWLFLAEWNMVTNSVSSSGAWPFVAFHQYGDAALAHKTYDVDAFLGTQDQLLKYGYTGPTVPDTGPPPTPPPPPPPPAQHTYTVQSGDTLSSIAARFSMTWQELWNFANNRSVVANPNLIFPGEVLTVPGETPAPPAPAGCDYTIISGDTLSGIAAAYGMSWQQLWDFSDNRARISNPDLIFAGQTIKVPC